MGGTTTQKRKSRNGYTVEVLADSFNPNGVRLTTLLCRYPRFIHSEMLRHRMFSHSVASSRAIPTEALIKQVREDPFVPAEFNQRVKGMGVGDALLAPEAAEAEHVWRESANFAADRAEEMVEIGLDKSRANRLLEPFLFVWDIITATEWDNFFALRTDKAAQPEFQFLANMMLDVRDRSVTQSLNMHDWHLPMIDPDEMQDAGADPHNWKLISAARCARVSFDNFKPEPITESLRRAAMLIRSGHLSPFEHVATPFSMVRTGSAFSANFRGWKQFRKEFPNEDRFDRILSSQSV